MLFVLLIYDFHIAIVTALFSKLNNDVSFSWLFFANTSDKLVFIVILEIMKYLTVTQVEQSPTLETVFLDHDSLMEKMNNWNFQIFDLVQEMGDQSGRILSQVCGLLL